MKIFTDKILMTDCVLIIVLSAAVYGRLLGCDFQTSWDDNWAVLYDDSIRGISWEHIKKAFSSYVIGSYVPLCTVSYMLDYTMWGLNPAGYHLTNIILHTLNAVLFYRLIFNWYDRRLTAMSAALLYLVHPVQVEVVAWVTQRQTLLCVMFFLLSWECYCRYRSSDNAAGRLPYIFSLIAFLLALLAKSAAVVLPLILIMYDFFFLEGKNRIKLVDKVPFIICAVAVAAVSLVSQTEPDGARTLYHGGNPYSTLMTMLPVFSRYLGMLVWPANLSAFYAPQIRQSLDIAVAGSSLLLACIVFAGIWSYRKDRKHLFWVLFFFATLLPVSQIIPINTLMQDRYLYFPMMGVAVLAGSGISRIREIIGGRLKPVLYAVLGLLLSMLAMTSFNRTAVWKDSVTLWSDAVAKEPLSDKAWGTLGESLMSIGRNQDSLYAYERGFAINPSNTWILHGLGELYTNLGKFDKGYDLLSKLLKIRPDYVTGWASLGKNYQKRGMYNEAEAAYLAAYRLQPEALQIVMLRADLEFERNRPEKARELLLKTESEGRGSAESAYLLACALAVTNMKVDALAWLETAIIRGFDNYGLLVEDKRLAALGADPGFNQLIQKYSGIK